MIWILKWLDLNGQKRDSLWKSIVLWAQLADTSSWFLIVLGSSPNVLIFFLTFFWPPYQVSTQCLSSSKWLTRGGKRPRCVHFCAVHSQCLPKTVFCISRKDQIFPDNVSRSFPPQKLDQHLQLFTILLHPQSLLSMDVPCLEKMDHGTRGLWRRWKWN